MAHYTLHVHTILCARAILKVKNFTEIIIKNFFAYSLSETETMISCLGLRVYTQVLVQTMLKDTVHVHSPILKGHSTIIL